MDLRGASGARQVEQRLAVGAGLFPVLPGCGSNSAGHLVEVQAAKCVGGGVRIPAVVQPERLGEFRGASAVGVSPATNPASAVASASCSDIVGPVSLPNIGNGYLLHPVE